MKKERRGIRQLAPEPDIVTSADVRRLVGQLRWKLDDEVEREKAEARKRKRRRAKGDAV